MEKTKLDIGDVVQIDPVNASNPAFGGCMLVVTEVKSWGVQGYVQALGDRTTIGGQAYYRAKWEEIEFVGRSQWIAE